MKEKAGLWGQIQQEEQAQPTHLSVSRVPAPAHHGSAGAHLLLGADEAGGDAGGVDAAAGVLVDLDVGLAVAGIRVAGTIEEVEDLLIVELCGREMGLGVCGHGPGPPGLSPATCQLCSAGTETGPGWLPSHPGLPGVPGSGLFPLDGAGAAGSWAEPTEAAISAPPSGLRNRCEQKD